eukprot:1161338-Pelagomonas_calceolata.AAC.7
MREPGGENLASVTETHNAKGCSPCSCPRRDVAKKPQQVAIPYLAEAEELLEIVLEGKVESLRADSRAVSLACTPKVCKQNGFTCCSNASIVLLVIGMSAACLSHLSSRLAERQARRGNTGTGFCVWQSTTK